MELTNYQRFVLDQDGYVALVGGRQIGKTEVALRKTEDRYRDGDNVLVITSTHRMSQEFMKRMRSRVEDKYVQMSRTRIDNGVSGQILSVSVSSMRGEEIYSGSPVLLINGEAPDLVVIEEATFIKENILRGLISVFELMDENIPILMTLTEPVSWQGERPWEDQRFTTVRIPTVANPFIDYDRITDIYGQMSPGQRDVELLANRQQE